MSLFGDDDFTKGIERLQFRTHFDSIVTTLRKYGWKVKLVIWRDDGETWEITPVSDVKTQEAKQLTKKVDVSVKS